MVIRLEQTKKTLSRFGGLSLFQRVAERLSIAELVKPHLPTSGFHGESTPAQKYLSLITGFVCGLDCLDDRIPLAQDPGFHATAGHAILRA